MSWDRIKVPLSHWEHEPYVDDMASSRIAAIGVYFVFVILVVWFGIREGRSCVQLARGPLGLSAEECGRTRHCLETQKSTRKGIRAVRESISSSPAESGRKGFPSRKRSKGRRGNQNVRHTLRWCNAMLIAGSARQ